MPHAILHGRLSENCLFGLVVSVSLSIYVILQDKGLGLDDGGHPADDYHACEPYFEEMHLSSNSRVDLQSMFSFQSSFSCSFAN